MDFAKFRRERDSALLSLDKDMIVAYMKKYGIVFCPKDGNVFWASVHKARLEILDFPESEKEISRKWLKDNGFKAGISPSS